VDNLCDEASFCIEEELVEDLSIAAVSHSCLMAIIKSTDEALRQAFVSVQQEIWNFR
jgi:hypothetical protein